MAPAPGGSISDRLEGAIANTRAVTSETTAALRRRKGEAYEDDCTGCSTVLLSGLADVAEAQGAESLSGTSGRYAAVMEMDVTLVDHTIYRPADLSKVQGKLPIVSFGNGGCINIGSAFKTLFGEVASYGYLAIATGPIGPEPAFPGPRPPARRRAAAGWPTHGRPSRRHAVRAVQDGIARQGDRLGHRRERAQGQSDYGRIDTTKIAVAGQSCGGLQAIAVGADPRVTTVMVLNSGIIRGGIPTPDGGTRQPAGYLPASEQILPKLHTPMLYLIGGEKDQAHQAPRETSKLSRKFRYSTPTRPWVTAAHGDSPVAAPWARSPSTGWIGG